VLDTSAGYECDRVSYNPGRTEAAPSFFTSAQDLAEYRELKALLAWTYTRRRCRRERSRLYSTEFIGTPPGTCTAQSV